MKKSTVIAKRLNIGIEPNWFLLSARILTTGNNAQKIEYFIRSIKVTLVTVHTVSITD